MVMYLSALLLSPKEVSDIIKNDGKTSPDPDGAAVKEGDGHYLHFALQVNLFNFQILQNVLLF